MRLNQPTFEELVKEIDELKADRKIALDDLPIADLQRKLSSSWQPAGSELLRRGTVGPDLLEAVPVGQFVAAGLTTSSTTPVDGASPLAVTLPRTGRYLVAHGAGLYTSVGGTAFLHLLLDAGQVNQMQNNMAGTSLVRHPTKLITVNASAGQVLRQRYSVLAGATGDFFDRFIFAFPIT